MSLHTQTDRVFSIANGYEQHGEWSAASKEDAFQACRKWYGPRMPNQIELFTIIEKRKKNNT